MRALMQKPSSESILTTFLHQAFPEGAMVETDASGNVLEQSSGGIMQTVSAVADVDFFPWMSSEGKGSFKRDGFAFFDEPSHFSDSDAIMELAAMANADGLTAGDLGKANKAFERAFQSKAAELIRKHDPTLADLIMVPTQPMLRRATGPGSSGRYMPHVDFDFRLSSHELVAPWWRKSWGRYILTNESVRKTLVEAGSLEEAAVEPGSELSASELRCTVDEFSDSFDVVGIQTVWVSLNSGPCHNNQLALCSWASVDKENDLKEYQIFGPGITAIGLHPNRSQRWVAPSSLRFGQGVRFNALAAPHVAVAREPAALESSADAGTPRLSVECRVLMLKKRPTSEGSGAISVAASGRHAAWSASRAASHALPTSSLGEQIQDQGFAVARGAISPGLLSDIRRHFAWLRARHPDIPPEHLHHPLVRRDALWMYIATHTDMLRLVRPVIGPNVALFASHYVCKDPHVGLEVLPHQDVWPLRPMEVVSAFVAVDECSRRNGGLQVMPGSHHLGLRAHCKQPDENVFGASLDNDARSHEPATPLDLMPGDVVLMHANVAHASAANTSDMRRCALTLRYIPTTTEVTNQERETSYLWLAAGEAQPGINTYHSWPLYIDDYHPPFPGCEQWNERRHVNAEDEHHFAAMPPQLQVEAGERRAREDVANVVDTLSRGKRRAIEGGTGGETYRTVP
jgi:phytanoyl-CoA hydroxylase